LASLLGPPEDRMPGGEQAAASGEQGQMSRSLSWGGRSIVLSLLVFAGLVAVTPESAWAQWRKDRVPNVTLLTQHGKPVHFYDDLIKDKIFLVNFLFTTCGDICPLAAARLSQLQSALGDAMGRDVFFYSITVDPEIDTPERLKEYADTFGAGPGWIFLTGKPADIRQVRDKLGDPGKGRTEHRNEILLGNGKTGAAGRNSILADIPALVFEVRGMDPNWAPPKAARRTSYSFTLNFASRKGEALFARMCAGCHTVGGGNKVGPDLAGLAERRERDWLIRFLTDPEGMRRRKDPIALDLVAAFPTVRMPPLGVTGSDADDLLAYVAYREENARRQRPLNALDGLTTHTGATLTAETLKGHPVAVFFGFTHCPDVCPTTLQDWSIVLDGLGKDGDRLKVLFVSVDPERDTPAALASYLGSFDPRITALTGSAAQVARAALAFDAFHEKAASGSGYTYDHTTNVYLVGRNGRVAGKVDLRTPEVDRHKLLADLLSQP
jgi:protein SCO1